MSRPFTGEARPGKPSHENKTEKNWGGPKTARLILHTPTPGFVNDCPAPAAQAFSLYPLRITPYVQKVATTQSAVKMMTPGM